MESYLVWGGGGGWGPKKAHIRTSQSNFRGFAGPHGGPLANNSRSEFRRSGSRACALHGHGVGGRLDGEVITGRRERLPGVHTQCAQGAVPSVQPRIGAGMLRLKGLDVGMLHGPQTAGGRQVEKAECSRTVTDGG